MIDETSRKALHDIFIKSVNRKEYEKLLKKNPELAAKGDTKTHLEISHNYLGHDIDLQDTINNNLKSCSTNEF